MLGLFKRTKIESWEIEIIKSVLIKLPDDYKRYLLQIEEGLLKGVLIGLGDIPNYVGFTYNSSVYNKFYESNGENFKLSHIKIRDTTSNKLIEFSLYFAYGVINGYSTDIHLVRIRLNPHEININDVRKYYIGKNDFNNISNLFSSSEIKMINPNDVYISVLNGKDFYHIRELEDGDFIGIDLDNNLYKITQDPFKITLLDRNQLEFLIGAGH